MEAEERVKKAEEALEDFEHYDVEVKIKKDGNIVGELYTSIADLGIDATDITDRISTLSHNQHNKALATKYLGDKDG